MCSPAWRYSTGAGLLPRQTRYRNQSSYQSLMPAGVSAHQGMKTRRSDLVQRIGEADSATPRPDPCGGQAPALHSPLPHLIVGPLVVY